MWTTFFPPYIEIWDHLRFSVGGHPAFQDMEGTSAGSGEGVAALAFSADGNSLAAFSLVSLANSGAAHTQGTLRVWSLAASWRQTMFLQRIAITVHARVRRAVTLDSKTLVSPRSSGERKASW